MCIQQYSSPGQETEEKLCEYLLNRVLAATKAKSIASLPSAVQFLIKAGLKMAYLRWLRSGSGDTYQAALFTLMMCDSENGILADYRLEIVRCITKRPKGKWDDPYAESVCLALIHRPDEDHVLLLHCDMRKIDIIKTSEVRDCLAMYCREPCSDRLEIKHYPVDVTFPYVMSVQDCDAIAYVQTKLHNDIAKTFGAYIMVQEILCSVRAHIKWSVNLVAIQHIELAINKKQL